MTVAQVSEHSVPAAVAPWVWAVLIAAGLIATFTDLRSMRIPNWLTLPLLASGLAYGAARGGWAGLGDAAIGVAIAGAIFVAAYAIAGGGAGDAKLMMALGAWLGAYPSVVLVLGVTICGLLWAIVVTIYRDGVAAVPLMLMHGLLWTRMKGAILFRGVISGTALRKKSVRDEGIYEAAKPRPEGWFPYAPAILVGTAASWWYWHNYGSLV